MDDIGAISSAIQDAQFEALYAVKLIKAQQESEKVISSILEDTAEISKEAMEKFTRELGL